MRQLRSLAVISCVMAAGCSRNHPAAPTSSSEPAVVRSMPAAGSSPQLMTDATKPIRLVQGAIVFDFTFRGGSLRGTEGFRFDSRLGDGSVPGAMCRFSTDCTPGAVVVLHGEFGGLDAAGGITWRGNTYEAGGEIGSFITIDGSFVAPPRADTAVVTVPFTLKGFFDPPQGRQDYEGQGTATLHLQWDPSLDSWGIVDSRYEIEAGHPSPAV